MILLMFFTISGCAKTVRTTQQGQTYNTYKAQQYQNISKKKVNKPKTKRDKQNW